MKISTARQNTSLVCTVGLLLFLAACNPEISSNADSARPIAWVDVASAQSAAVRTVPAVIQSKDRADLAFQVPGRVSLVNANVGDTVADEAVLAALDDTTFRLTLKQRRAELAQATAVFVEAESDFNRISDLIKDGAISKTQFEKSRARLDTARGSVDLLKAAVGLARKNLDYTQLRAPYAGEITFRDVEPAQQVQVGQTVLAIQLESILEATMTVPEDWINRLVPGSTHNVTLRSLPGLEITGRITEIGRDARANNAFPITLELENTPETVRSGMSAEVTLRGVAANENRDNVLIPLTAFVAGNAQDNYVFVVDSDAGIVKKRAIELGSIVENGIQVTAGLKPGERIASKGVAYLTDGQAITLLNVGPLPFLQ